MVLFPDEWVMNYFLRQNKNIVLEDTSFARPEVALASSR
jgi:hypothetical protein